MSKFLGLKFLIVSRIWSWDFAKHQSQNAIQSVFSQKLKESLKNAEVCWLFQILTFATQFERLY